MKTREERIETRMDVLQVGMKLNPLTLSKDDIHQLDKKYTHAANNINWLVNHALQTMLDDIKQGIATQEYTDAIFESYEWQVHECTDALNEIITMAQDKMYNLIEISDIMAELKKDFQSEHKR